MHRVASALPILVIGLLLLGTTPAFGQPTYSIIADYSQPTYLGQYMSVLITVTNLASTPMRIENLIVDFDWVVFHILCRKATGVRSASIIKILELLALSQ
jgi:hypothetical protein